MPLNHMFSITMCNTKLILKLALFLLVLAILVFAVLSAVLNPMISDLVKLISDTEVEASQFINHPFKTTKETFWDNCIKVYLNGKDLGAIITYLVLTYFFVRFFSLMPQLPVTKVLYNKMISGYDVGLVNSFIQTGFQNLLLSLILAIITTVLNGGLFVGFAALAVVCVRGGVYALLPFVILGYIVAISVKSCLFSQWMPEICASQTKNIFVGIKNAFKGTFLRFRKNFLCFFTINVIGFAVVAATIVPSLGAIPLLFIPAFIVMRATLSLTLNFSYHSQKYFVDNGTTVYTPTKLF